MSITVGKLKDKLEAVLSDLENFEDNQKINLVSNTYFLGHTSFFLGIAGYDGGYLDLNNIEVEEEENNE